MINIVQIYLVYINILIYRWNGRLFKVCRLNIFVEELMESEPLSHAVQGRARAPIVLCPASEWLVIASQLMLCVHAHS